MNSRKYVLLSIVLALSVCICMLSGCQSVPDTGEDTMPSEPAVSTTDPTVDQTPTDPVEDNTTEPGDDQTPTDPVDEKGNSASTSVVTDTENKVSDAVSMSSTDGVIHADIPVGVKLADGTSELTLSVSDVADSVANITLGENEIAVSIDVHMDGVAEDNDVVMAIVIKALLDKGLNMGNYRFYHVENGQTVEMTLLAEGATPVHNSYAYDPATGDVVLHLKSFSEVAYVADTKNAWEGNFDYTWYDSSKTELTISNADQLAAFGAIVGGMAEGIEQDSFKDKTVKLLANINLGDDEANNDENKIFYPVGYYNNTGSYNKQSDNVGPEGVAVVSGFRNFEGTFDGNGNTISNFYQNTWEMFGDYNDGYSGTPNHYRDGMGLFGRVYGGTIKNLTVENFSSDGEFTTTGTIAAYADFGATFENITIFNCNPRVYNIGNGGIVGCVGWYTKDVTENKVTFKNITVDNSNKISALWGSWDVACGGLVGQYYPTSGQSSAGYPLNAGIHMENCHVAAQIDVYNDVCANYQYYAYRYAGMLIGSIRENEEKDGHVYPKMDGITAKGCTVHFGDWNDYYYCELVANSLASYTHDHQMSRLEQVAGVDVENKKVTKLNGDIVDIPESGRVNYVVVKAKDANGMWIHGDGHEFAECYHFVNGVQHFHDIADSDNTEVYETVDGVKVLKEDKQLIYREFNQLFTGYGWGVTSKGLTDYEGVENMDIKHSDEEESVEKFVSLLPNGIELEKDIIVTIGDLFAAKEDAGVDIKSDNVQVFVSPADDDSYVDATYTANTSDWTKGKLRLVGSGMVTISITDYNYCKTTTVTVALVDFADSAEKPPILDGDNNPSVDFG